MPVVVSVCHVPFDESGLKLHTLLDPFGAIPGFIHAATSGSKLKVAAMTATTHNPFDKFHAGELLQGERHEQFLWGGIGGRAATALRQPITRQLLLRWIKQHLHIKAFFNTSGSAVKSQNWIAVSVYVRVALIKWELQIYVSLHSLLQILSVMLFDRMPLQQALADSADLADDLGLRSQVNLFDTY